MVQRKGRSLFEQNGHTAWLKPGDWSLYDTTRSYIVSAPSEVDLHILLLPRNGILRGRRDLEHLMVHRLRGRTGMGRLACAAIEQALQDAEAGRLAGTAAGERIVELLHDALLEHAGSRLRGERQSVLRERIKDHIERHLADPELDVDAVARALHCSKRALHKAFEEEDNSLRDYLWDRRLQAAKHQLERASAGGSITCIAFACGFSNAEHFSRLFRARFGASPASGARNTPGGRHERPKAIRPAAGFTERRKAFREQCYIDGAWTGADSKKTFAVRNPASGAPLGSVPDLGAAETRRAIEAAERALPAWRAKTGKERSAILRKWNDLILASLEDLALLLTTEQGKPLAEARGEIQIGAAYVEWFAEEAKRIYGDTIPTPWADKRIVVVKQPVGVCAAITPWNFPHFDDHAQGCAGPGRGLHGRPQAR